MDNCLAENIKKLRQLKGINQIEFGKKINVSKQCVSNWENGNVMPSIEMLIKISNFFNTTTDNLLGISNNKTINVSELTDIQITHIANLIEDLKAINNKN